MRIEKWVVFRMSTFNNSINRSYIVLISAAVLCLINTVTASYLYYLPTPDIQVFYPCGFQISIPDEDGISLFAVHANINRDLRDLEAGDISHDVIRRTNAKWVYKNDLIKLNIGDAINYWLFVIKDGLGYRIDGQQFIVTEYSNQPSNNSLLPNTGYGSQLAAGYQPPNPQSTSVYQELNTGHKQPENVWFNNSPINTYQPINTSNIDCNKYMADCLECFVNRTKTNTDEMKQLRELNAMLINKIEQISKPEEMNRLLVEGVEFPNEIGPTINELRKILNQELKLNDITGFVQYVTKNNNGTVIFQTSTYGEKVKVLQAAKEHLKNSKISIKNI